MTTIGNPPLLRAVPAALAMGAVALFAATASAQVTASGQVDLGARQLYGNRASSKFLEYRSIPEGFFVRGLELNLEGTKPGYFLTLRARDALEGDQSIQLRAGRYGRYELALDFDKVPHVFTNTGRSLFTQQSPGVFTLPDQVRADLRKILTTDTDPSVSGVQPDLAALGALINGLSQPVDVSFTREKGKASLRYTPSPEWDLRVQYSLETKKGVRPFGATFSFNPNEQREPIDYSTHEIQANVERSGTNWAVQAGYVGTIYRDHVGALVWDNPFQESPDVSGSPARGRIDLYPDNAAHLGTLSAGFGLPLRGRWSTTVAYGMMSQNDELLPFTINSAITGVPSLPASTADAKIKTLQLNSVVTLKPVPRLGLGLRYRYYNRDNETPQLIFSNYVRTDQLLSGVARSNLPYGYSRQNATVDATWQVGSAIAVKGGYEWERWDREHRETRTTNENALSGVVDVTHQGWLFVRGSFRRSDRSAGEYSAHRVAEETFPAGEPGLGQLEALRKFDQADRTQNRAELIARVSPADNVSASASYSLTDDDYDKSEYGLLENRNSTATIEVSFSPGAATTLFADYARAVDHFEMRSRQRTPTNDNADNAWGSDIRDRVNTYGGGLSRVMLPGKLDLDLRYHRSDGEDLTRTSTPGTPDLVTTARDYPLVVSDWQSLLATVRYTVSSRVLVSFEYRFEEYEQADFALDVMAPFMGNLDPASAGTTWLGVTRPDFQAHLASLIFSLRL